MHVVYFQNQFMSIHHMQAHRKIRYAIIIIKPQPKHCSPKIEPVKGTGQ